MALKVTFLGINGDNDTPVSISQGGTETHRVHPSHIGVEYISCKVQGEDGNHFSAFFDSKAVPGLEEGQTYAVDAIKALSRVPGTKIIDQTDHVLTDQELENPDIKYIRVAQNPTLIQPA